MSKLGMVLEVVLLLLTAACLVLLFAMDFPAALVFYSCWGIPTLLLAGCSWCVRGKKSAPWIILGCWLAFCFLTATWSTWPFKSNDYLVESLVMFPASTFLTGPLAVLTSRMQNGWRIMVCACFPLPMISFAITLGILYELNLSSWGG